MKKVSVLAKDRKPSAATPEKASNKPENAETESLPELRPQLAEEIKHGIEPLLQKNQTTQVMNVVQSVLLREHFSGPLPHPRHFREYDEIAPGSAERIIRMAEKAQDHNINMEAKVVDAQIDDQKRGMNYGLLALLVVLGLGGLFAFLGNNVAAGLFLGTSVLGVVGAFITGRVKKSNK
ncbi:DUF2335 domain-containing protein [Roseibium sp.]|uniref:DUF2335 domain-containing protein n=1 Tax=Roseibium sp. TaxID=1936156 RepID=UPI003B523CA3